jgi:excisionase family DNA binding protein
MVPGITKEPMLDAAQIAGELNICQSKARRMMREGQIPAIKVGRIWRARRLDVESVKRGQPPVDPRIAEIIAAAEPLTDQQVDDIVAIIRADQSGKR